jgi:tetratricopeptide (TPR) repeat protein
MSRLSSVWLIAVLLPGVGCGADSATPADSDQVSEAAAPALSQQSEQPVQMPLVVPAVAAAETSGAADEGAEFEDAPAVDPATLAALEAAVAANPEDATAHRRLGIALHKLTRRVEAVEQFEAAVEIDSSVRHLLDLALAYNTVARPSDAEAVYERILTIEPNHAVTLHNLGNIAGKRADRQRAIEFYRKAIAADPQYLRAQFNLARAHEKAEQYKEAYREYGKVLEMEPRTPAELELFDDALYRMASLDIKMGEYVRAGQILVEVIRADPKHDSAHYAYGQVLLQLGRPEEAQKEFETHMQILSEQHPKNPMSTGE